MLPKIYENFQKNSLNLTEDFTNFFAKILHENFNTIFIKFYENIFQNLHS